MRKFRVTLEIDLPDTTAARDPEHWRWDILINPGGQAPEENTPVRSVHITEIGPTEAANEILNRVVSEARCPRPSEIDAINEILSERG